MTLSTKVILNKRLTEKNAFVFFSSSFEAILVLLLVNRFKVQIVLSLTSHTETDAGRQTKATTTKGTQKKKAFIFVFF